MQDFTQTRDKTARQTREFGRVLKMSKFIMGYNPVQISDTISFLYIPVHSCFK